MSVAVKSRAAGRRSAPHRAIAAAAVLLAVGGCEHPAPPAPPAVVVALPVHPDSSAGGSTALIRYPVEVLARYSNLMSFRVPGKLIERKLRLGDSVRQGEVVARLDPDDAGKQLASARAALDAAEHRLLFARQQLDRDNAQAAQSLIATNQLEQTQDAFTAALAAREQAADQLVVARNNLEYNTLVADHDGVITSENADTGQVVAAGQAVYGLAWTGDTDAVLDAAASDLGRIAVGQPAQVTFPALAGQRFEARVREIGPAADPQSRTYRVKLTLTQPGRAVRLGMTGDATLAPLASAGSPTDPQTFTLPATAIFHKGNSPAVWVVGSSDSSLELRAVTVRTYTDHSAIIASGLKDGESVVLAGVHTVHAGERVRPVRPLFDGDGDVESPANGGTNSGAPR